MLSSQASASNRESRRAFLKAAPLAATTFVLADGWLPLRGAAREPDGCGYRFKTYARS